MNSIEPSEIKNINGTIIDIRNKEKYREHHIPSSINVPAQELIIQPEKYMKKNEEYYIYCQKGITSIKICKILKIKGYKITNINGGYEKWKETI